MSPQLFEEYLSREIDRTVYDVLKDIIPSIKYIQDLPSQINRLGQMVEGKDGVLGLIAKANNYVLEGKSFKLQTDELFDRGYITKIVKIKIDSIRTLYNITKHEGYYRKKIKITDVKEIRDLTIDVLEWFYCECPVGPKLESIFIPHKVISVNVGHLRTLVSLAKVSSKGVKCLNKIRTLNSQEFFSLLGFKAFCSLVDQYLLGEHIDGLSVGIAAEVEIDGIIRSAFVSSGWPERLSKEIRAQFPKIRISLLNDAVGYACGIKKENLKTPILVLTLGDGVGCAMIKDESVKGKELGLLSISRGKNIHQYLGTEYFSKEACVLQWDYKKIRNEYSLRVIDTIKILKDKFDFNSVALGGGRSVFCDEVALNNELKKYHIVISIQSEDEILLNGLANYWRLEQFERKI